MHVWLLIARCHHLSCSINLCITLLPFLYTLLTKGSLVSPLVFEQHICLDCKNNFCPLCSNRPESGPLLCHLCQRFRATAFQREELIKMKVKDLRDYLALHEISTETCREKEELVFLILNQQPVITQEDRLRIPPLTTGTSGQEGFVLFPPPSPASATSHDASPVSTDPISSTLTQEHQQVFLSPHKEAPCPVLIHPCCWLNYWDAYCFLYLNKNCANKNYM